MSIRVDRNIKAITRQMTGDTGISHTGQALAFGTQRVAGATSIKNAPSVGIALILALGLLMSGPVAARAPDQQVEQLATIAVVKGRCDKLILSGADATEFCLPEVLNHAYKSEKSSFQFTAKDHFMLTFYGQDHFADGDESYLDVERIDVNLLLGTPTTSAPATGRCTYTNPFVGISRIRCRAVYNGRQMEASFTSDGQPPTVEEF